jgi:hypothetical protein
MKVFWYYITVGSKRMFEKIQTYVCNICFQHHIALLLRRVEARRHVEFASVELTGGMELATPIEKVAAGRAGGEGGRKAWWRGRKASVHGGQEARWKGRKTGGHARARCRCQPTGARMPWRTPRRPGGAHSWHCIIFFMRSCGHRREAGRRG